MPSDCIDIKKMSILFPSKLNQKSITKLVQTGPRLFQHSSIAAMEARGENPHHLSTKNGKSDSMNLMQAFLNNGPISRPEEGKNKQATSSLLEGKQKLVQARRLYNNKSTQPHSKNTPMLLSPMTSPLPSNREAQYTELGKDRGEVGSRRNLPPVVLPGTSLT